MSKVLAFLSYGVNAGVMLAVALFLATTLTAAEYSRYSFAVATAQTLAVCIFEWLRMAATRYYPGPTPSDTANLRGAFLGGQYLISICAVISTWAIARWLGDYSWLLITCYAVLQGVVDLQFTMLRFDARLRLFSKLQTTRGILALALAVSAAFLFQNANAALLGGILANILTVAMLEFSQPGFVLVRPTVRQISQLRQMATYGVSAAAAGGLYQFGPFLMRCAAFRGASETSYAAFSLVVDLMQRPYNVALTALNGVFFPDAVREHDRSPNSERIALRRLYAIQVWCLLLIFGCAMAFRHELMPLIVKSPLVPHVLEVFPYLAAFFLVHAAIQTTSALVLHLSRAGLKLIIQAALELGGIAILTVFSTFVFGAGIVPVACGGMLGAIIGILFTASDWRDVPCRLPWTSWAVALITTLVLLVVGQTDSPDQIQGFLYKITIVAPVVAIGGFLGLAIPFGLLGRLHQYRLRVVQPTESIP